MIDIKISPEKFIWRIFDNLLEGGGVTILLLAVFIYGLINGNIDILKGSILGCIILVLAVLTWNRVKWYYTFITRIVFLDDRLLIDYFLRDQQQKTVEFFLASSNITFTVKGKGGANTFMIISDETKTLKQIDTGDWTTEIFAEVLLNFKKLKKENFTYDEQDWLKRLADFSDD